MRDLGTESGARRPARLAAVPAAVVLCLALVSCDDAEPVVIVRWPEMNGAFQYRSLMPVDAGGLTCVEHGDITISHAGEDTFTASGDITLDCWVGNEAIATPSGVTQFTQGRFGPETNKESWPMTWEGRPSWTYAGEVFWATPTHMRASGNGEGIVDLPDGSQATRGFTWAICRRFAFQNDPVEQGCDYS